MSIESRVVPAMLVTIFLSSPIKAFIKDDFPALGLPTTANLGNSSFSKSTSSGAGMISANASSNSPVPLPLIDEMVWYSPKPKL